MQTRATRDVFLGQISAIVLSKRFARGNIRNLLDFMIRRAEIPGEALVVAKSASEKLVDMKLENNFVPVTYLLRYFQSTAKRPMAIPVKLWELDRALANGITDAHLPLMETSQGQYRIAGTLLYSGNKVVGELNTEETGILTFRLGERLGILPFR